jgi:hypothetical protein
MDVPCDPTTVAGWLALIAVLLIGVLRYAEDEWTERRKNSGKVDKDKANRLPRFTLGLAQLLLIGAIGALVAQTALGGSIIDGVSNGVSWIGVKTSGAYAMGRGAVAVILAVALAILWFIKPTAPVAMFLGIALLVLAGISPHVQNVITFVIDHFLSAVSGVVRWLVERRVQ